MRLEIGNHIWLLFPMSKFSVVKVELESAEFSLFLILVPISHLFILLCWWVPDLRCSIVSIFFLRLRLNCVERVLPFRSPPICDIVTSVVTFCFPYLGLSFPLTERNSCAVLLLVLPPIEQRGDCMVK